MNTATANQFEITDNYALRFVTLMMGAVMGGTNGKDLNRFVDEKSEQLAGRVKFEGRAFLKVKSVSKATGVRGRKPKDCSGLPKEFTVKEAKKVGIPNSAIIRLLNENKIVKVGERRAAARGASMIVYRRVG